MKAKLLSPEAKHQQICFISLCLSVLEMTVSQHTAVCSENPNSLPLCFYCYTQFEVSEWKKDHLFKLPLHYHSHESEKEGEKSLEM